MRRRRACPVKDHPTFCRGPQNEFIGLGQKILKSPPTTGDIRLLRILSLTVLMVQWTAAEDELSGLEGDYHTHPFQGRPKTHPFQSENHARWNEIHISEINLIDRFIPLWLNWTQTKNTRQSTMYFRQLNFWVNTILYIITMPLPCLLFDWSNKIA